MRFIVLFFFIGLGFMGAANASPYDFSYELKKAKNLNPAFTHFIQKQGYKTLIKKTGYLRSELPFDQLAMAPNKKDFILFKNGLTPSKEKIIGKVLTHPKGYLYHGNNYALFFTHKNKTAVMMLLRKLKKSNFALSFNLLPEAHAAYCPSCENAVMGRAASNNVNMVADLANKAVEQNLMDATFECLGQAWDGFKTNMSDTAGMVASVGKGIWSAVTDPKGAWNKAVSGAKAIVQAAEKIPKMVSSLVKGISEFPFSIQRSFICMLTGMLGAEGVIQLATGGAALAKVGLLISSLALSFSKVKKLLAWLEKLPDTDKNKTKDMEYIVSNLNKYPEGHLDMVDDFASIGSGKIARRLATCAL